MPKTACLSWDWKSSPSFEELKRALEPLGVHVYVDPTTEGSDSYGYIFADGDLTAEEVEAVAAERYEG